MLLLGLPTDPLVEEAFDEIVSEVAQNARRICNHSLDTQLVTPL